MQGALAQRPSIGDLPPSISPTRITLSLLLLAAQTLPKNSALSLVRINMLVHRLMADGQSCCNLLRCELIDKDKAAQSAVLVIRCEYQWPVGAQGHLRDGVEAHGLCGKMGTAARVFDVFDGSDSGGDFALTGLILEERRRFK